MFYFYTTGSVATSTASQNKDPWSSRRGGASQGVEMFGSDCGRPHEDTEVSQVWWVELHAGHLVTDARRCLCSSITSCLELYVFGSGFTAPIRQHRGAKEGRQEPQNDSELQLNPPGDKNGLKTGVKVAPDRQRVPPRTVGRHGTAPGRDRPFGPALWNRPRGPPQCQRNEDQEAPPTSSFSERPGPPAAAA